MKRTKEEAIASLERFVKEANGKYTKREYQRLGYTPSHPTILSLFGSWEQALKEVGSSLVPTELYTDEELLAAVRQSIEENGGIPSRSKYMSGNIKPSITTVEVRFGSWSKAVQRAGYTPNTYVTYTCSDEEMISALQTFYKENGNQIGYEAYEKSGRTPSASIIRKRYRTWNLALNAAGIPLNQRKKPLYEDKHMMTALKRVAKELPCPVSKKLYQFHAREQDPSPISIIRRYRTWSNALEVAELPPVKNSYTDEEMLLSIRAFVEFVGETEASLDLYVKMGWLPGATSIRRRFGTWEKALKENGYALKFAKYTKEYAIAQIQIACEEAGGEISSEIYSSKGYKPSMKWIRSHFGSWRKAKQEANCK